jgi:DNA-binding NarL/FixJ family response regulator
MRKERALLSPLMQTLLAGYANGKQLKEMAEDRYVSYSTATNTVYTAKQRLEAKNLAHAIVKSIGLGYLSSPTGPDLQVFPVLPPQ